MIEKNKKHKEILNKSDKIVIVVVITALLVIPVMILGMQYNKLIEIIGAAGTIVALVISLATLIYTENVRKKQNEYQYRKDKLEKSIEKLSDTLYEHIENIRTTEVMKMLINFSRPHEMVDYLLSNIMRYKLLLTTPQSRIYWYYDDKQYKESKELINFINELNEVIKEIDAVLNDLLSLLKESMTKLVETENEKYLDKNPQIELNIIQDMNDKLQEKFRLLTEINYKKVEMLYEKAKMVIKEYEAYKYDRLYDMQ